MIEQCDQSIASWSTDGKSFIIRNVDSFSNSVLPLYFKHSKFASFVRQLNFYSFRKLRENDRNNVCFAHEHFRQGQPELLHKITRITKSQEPSSSEMKSLKDDIFDLKKDIVSLSNRFDHRLQAMSSALEVDYKQRMNNLSHSYQALSALSAQILKSSQSVPVLSSEQQVRIVPLVSTSATNSSTSTGISKDEGKTVTPSYSNSESSSRDVYHTDIHATTTNVGGNGAASTTVATTSSKTRTQSTLMCPLMTLSGIASAMMDNASK